MINIHIRINSKQKKGKLTIKYQIYSTCRDTFQGVRYSIDSVSKNTQQ